MSYVVEIGNVKTLCETEHDAEVFAGLHIPLLAIKNEIFRVGEIKIYEGNLEDE